MFGGLDVPCRIPNVRSVPPGRRRRNAAGRSPRPRQRP